ncbi:DUF6221 family protein [Nocardia asiatica]|uniref:DUF6221 family protein n=1 Tax=Nocardia asiatica TaxID=209252 RepID=UPI0024543986|nr:DUF6221 family protein [Nocardia asiatica]
MTIVEFIEARLAEWENLAKSATELPQVTVKYPAKRPPWEPEQWRVDEYGDVVTVNGDRDPIWNDDGGVRGGHVAKLIATFDPAMVLELVNGLRGVLESLIWLDKQLSGTDKHHSTSYSYGALEDLAEIWREHPDYWSWGE